jgi:putative glutamine amidotransferase
VLDSGEEALAYLERLDGLLFTGSYSNVEPARYDGPPSADGTWHDPARDAFSLTLIPAALERGLPLLAICRGFQEMNVALGGSLHQALHELDGAQDHREDSAQPLEAQYGPAHAVELTPDGLLARLTGTASIEVNSLHTQGVDRLAPGLQVEGRAPDGIVEAYRLPSAPGFNLAVQWHPEWRAADNPVSRAIFGAFGTACAQRARARSTQ